MIDNFGLIKGLLNWRTEDDFYFLQILQRKKENKELGSNSRLIKTYTISSIHYLDNKKEEIIDLCNRFNARACINLNKRSFEKIGFHTLRKVTEQLMNKDFKCIKKAYDSCCGSYSNENDKTWILDCDYTYDQKTMNNISYFIQNCRPFGDKIVAKIPTKNGFHIITRPFDTNQFSKLIKEKFSGIILPEMDFHKDNPTILYIP